MTERVEFAGNEAGFVGPHAPSVGPRRTPAARPGGTPRVKVRERRRALRYRATMGRAWIGWREQGEFIRRASWILDVSSGGCLVAAEGMPAPGTQAYLRLDGAHLPEWYPVQVLDARDGERAIAAVRLIFPDGCPYELFMGLVYGRFAGPAGGA